MLNSQLDRLNINCSNSNNWENSKLDFMYLFFEEFTISDRFDLIIDALDILFLEKYNQPLSGVEELLLEGFWQRQTYAEIAKKNNYSSDYIANVAAPKLLKKISWLVGHRITKKNCCFVVTKYIVSYEKPGNRLI